MQISERAASPDVAANCVYESIEPAETDPLTNIDERNQRGRSRSLSSASAAACTPRTRLRGQPRRQSGFRGRLPAAVVRKGHWTLFDETR